MFADDFPSVHGRSINQDLLAQAGADIPIEDYLTIDFPPSFKAIYGTPVPYYRAWERLIDMPVRREIKLKIKQSFLQFVSHTKYLKHCKMIDEVVKRKNLVPVGRGEMDAAWVQQLVWLYDLDRKAMDMFLGYKLSYNHVLEDVEDVERTMKALLEQAVARRFDGPHKIRRNVEEYWTGKGALMSAMGQTLDITFVNDTFLEYQFNPPRDLSLEKDYPMRPNDGEILDTVMEEVEGNVDSDGVEYDSRSESDSEEDFEFPPDDDSEAEENDREEETGGNDVPMSGADQFTLPLR